MKIINYKINSLLMYSLDNSLEAQVWDILYNNSESPFRNQFFNQISNQIGNQLQVQMALQLKSTFNENT